MPDGPRRNLPAVGQDALGPKEGDAFARLELGQLVTIRVEAAHVFGREPGGKRRVEQLAADLEVPSQTCGDLLPQLAQEERAAPLERQSEEAPVHQAGPHASAELAVVGQAE